MSEEPTGTDPLPPRQAWEEPPTAGWASPLPGLGKELALFGLMPAVLLGVVRTIEQARQMSGHAQHGWSFALWVALWVLVGMLAAWLGLYVWRRLGGLALLRAMLTDHGRVRRMGGRPPVWLDAPPLRGLRIAHLSDLHIAEGATVRTIERDRPAGNQPLERLLDAAPLYDSDLVLVTGDITDRGTAAAWSVFLEAVKARGLADRLLLVPGNHDIAFVEQIDRKRALRLDRFGIVQLANLLKFGEAFAATAGGQRGVVWVGDEPRSFADAWHDAERAVRPLIMALPDQPVPPLTLRRWWSQKDAFDAYVKPLQAARERLLELFPVAVPLAERDAVIFVLNSISRVSRHPALNAIGHIGRAQYRRLDKLARQMPQGLKIVAVHHHLVRRGEEQSADFVHRLFAKFTVLGDTGPLVKFCLRHGVRAVLNGHRHLSYQLRLPSGTCLLAAPSSTLGDELSHDLRPQFESYAFAPRADGSTVGIYRQPIRLSREQRIVALAQGERR